MIHFLIFHKTSRLKFDMADISRPDAHQLHVVTQRDGGVKLSDENWSKVTSRFEVGDWDYESLRRVVSDAVRSWGRQSVRLISHDEYSLLFVAQLREEFGLPGPSVEQTMRFTNKPVMKAHISAAGLAVPRFTRLPAKGRDFRADRAAREIAAVTSLPAFAKQVAGTCSERAVRLDTITELTAWLDATSDLNSFEVDEFITGDLLHVDCVIQHGRVVHAQTSMDTFPNAEAVSEKPFGSITLPIESELAKRMLQYNLECLKALSPLIEGTTHLEFFRTPDDRFIFLEIAARSPGADFPRAYEINSGINFQSIYFKTHMGLPAPVNPRRGPYVVWCWYPRRTGRVAAYVEPELSSKYELTTDVSIGQQLKATHDTRLRSARFLLTNDDFDALTRDFNYLRHAYEPFIYE